MLWESYLDIFLGYNLNPEIGLDADALDNFTISDFKAVAKKFRDKGRRVTFHGPFIDLSPGSIDPEIIRITKKRLLQVLDLVPLFNPVTVVCHAGYDKRRYFFFQEEWLEKCLETWSWFGTRLEKKGAKLMLENVYESNPDEILPLLKNLEKDNVGFCFDPGHAFVFGKTPLESWITELGRYIGQVHLHDNNSQKDEHLALGTGSIDFKPVLEYLKSEKGAQTVITLEPHEEAALWPSLEYLEKSIPGY
jgi:sugar phosphate isomerase/epimerase